MSKEKLVQIRQMIQSRSGSVTRKPDRDAQRLLLYMFASTRGGFTRLRVVQLLAERPMNINQISTVMNLDYKAVQHHIASLERNNLVTRIGERYGVLFCLSTYLEANMTALYCVVQNLERQLNRKIVYL